MTVLKRAQSGVKFGLAQVVVPTHRVKFEDPDKELVDAVEHWLQDSQPMLEKITKVTEVTEKYYLGDQLDTNKLKEYQSRKIVNVVYQTMETIAPVAAANVPAPIITLPDEENDGKAVDNRTYSMQMEDTCLAIAQDNQLEAKLEDIVTQQEIYRLGVLHFKYEDEEGKIEICIEDPREFILPMNRKEKWVMKLCQTTAQCILEDLKEDKKEGVAHEKKEGEMPEISVEVRKKLEAMDKHTVIEYFHVYLPEFEFKMFTGNDGKVVWGKKKNPNWIEGKTPEDTKKLNFWSSPKTPFIFTDIRTLQLGHFAQTTDLEQIIPLQDGINRRKRQIDDAGSHANGQLIAYGSMGITRPQAAEVEAKRGKPNAVTFLDNAKQGSLQEFNGKQMEAFIFEDLQMDLTAVDNVAGTHANIRGEKTPGEETKGGRKLLMGADETRIGKLGKMLDRMSEQVYAAIIQLIMVHFDEDHWIPFTGEDGASKQVKISKANIRSGLKVRVRTGSTIRKDKVAEAAQAQELWRLGALDPISLYERLDDANPLRMATRLLSYKSNPQGYLPMVKKAYDEATQSDAMQKVLMGMAQATVENKMLLTGTPVAPYQEATVQHLIQHHEVMALPTFKDLPPEVKQAFKDHVNGEIPIVRKNALDARSESLRQQEERLRLLTGPDERS